MPAVVSIHNAVNERTWTEVLKWERLRGGDGETMAPKLVKFKGRPKDLSPKAWFKTTLLGYKAPFDRHDWTVQRADGETVRYVIDFYTGKVDGAGPKAAQPGQVAFHLDVRPALDSVGAFGHRLQMLWNETF